MSTAPLLSEMDMAQLQKFARLVGYVPDVGVDDTGVRQVTLTTPSGLKVDVRKWTTADSTKLERTERGEEIAAAGDSDVDFHILTAAAMFQVAPEQVTPAQRSAAKVVNFKRLYGFNGERD